MNNRVVNIIDWRLSSVSISSIYTDFQFIRNAG